MAPESLPALAADHRRKGFQLRKWHVVLFCLLWVPVIEGIVLAVGPASLPQFLGKIEKNRAGVAGDMYWSLFGRDDRCCDFVEHVRCFATVWLD
jgi:mannan endo-1,4-beta-mannosidase